MLVKKNNKNVENIVEYKKVDIYDKNFFINEELNKLIKELNSYSEEVLKKKIKVIDLVPLAR